MFRSRTLKPWAVLRANIYLFRLAEYYSSGQIRDTSFIGFTEEVECSVTIRYDSVYLTCICGLSFPGLERLTTFAAR